MSDDVAGDADDKRTDNEPDGPPGAESDTGDAIELIEKQERLLRGLSEASPARTRDLAVGLGRAMQRIAEDERLWGELEEAGALAPEAGPVAYLPLVDWEALLHEWGFPDAERTALELIDAVDRGAAEPPAWSRVRELLYELGGEIVGDAGEDAEGGGRWKRLKERMAVGVSALRRVRLGSLLARSTAGAATGAAPILAGVILGAPLGPVGMLAGAAICGLVMGAGSEVYAALKRLPEEDRSLLEALFKNPELQPGAEGGARADLEAIEAVLAEMSDETCEAALAKPLAKLRLWAARIGARLLSSWSVVQVRLGDAAVRDVQWALEATLALQQTLRAVAQLCGAAADSVRRAIDASRRDIGELGARLRQLDGTLADHGFGGHRA